MVSQKSKYASRCGGLQRCCVASGWVRPVLISVFTCAEVRAEVELRQLTGVLDICMRVPRLGGGRNTWFGVCYRRHWTMYFKLGNHFLTSVCQAMTGCVGIATAVTECALLARNQGGGGQCACVHCWEVGSSQTILETELRVLFSCVWPSYKICADL